MATKSKVIFIVIGGLILIVIGVFASILLTQRYQANRPSIAIPETTIKTSVVVVTRDLFLGDRIAAIDVKLVSVPVELAPRNAIVTLDEVVGKIVKTDLVQGEMLLAHNLAEPTKTINDLSFILDENHILMAFPAEDLLSQQNMVQRGDIIDIFATFVEEVNAVGVTSSTSETNEPEERTFTVDSLQNVSITAMVLETLVQQNPTDPDKRIASYLLALKPQDALILKHLKDIGAIFDIVLRAPNSIVQFILTPVTEEYIIEYYGLEILP